jgi:acetyl-CoA carboxylase biotin carboxylase subunit
LSDFMRRRRIRRVLVANRGEIALRVIRACRERGIETVAIASEADVDSLPVRIADHSICLGKPPSAQSYLNAEGIVAAARAFGVDAIHPGYGFLSEKAHFADLCETSGITFVGPEARVIRAMGDKIQAKRFAREAGVPTTPGSDGEVRDAAEAARVARAIGFPVLLKAAAGGGGRGMRIVERGEDLERLLNEAMGEAASAFGDPAIYVEKYLTNVRHIEIQVMGDGRHAVHLGERDCSTQRRNQKLVEEAPSPVLDDALRQRIADSAVRLCEHVGYRSAGTVEYILDQETGEFYFMEMNTRIQVEHPVTEMITGVDLVGWQLEIAQGATLAPSDRELTRRGHSIECRINAEDHRRGFAPSPGRITRFVQPGGPGVRVDTHVETGYLVPPWYDSMIAKVVCWGRDRDEALRRMLRALGEMRVEGITTTIPFHQQLLQHEDFRAGRVNTRFVHDVLGY